MFPRIFWPRPNCQIVWDDQKVSLQGKKAVWGDWWVCQKEERREAKDILDQAAHQEHEEENRPESDQVNLAVCKKCQWVGKNHEEGHKNDLGLKSRAKERLALDFKPKSFLCPPHGFHRRIGIFCKPQIDLVRFWSIFFFMFLMSCPVQNVLGLPPLFLLAYPPVSSYSIFALKTDFLVTPNNLAIWPRTKIRGNIFYHNFSIFSISGCFCQISLI